MKWFQHASVTGWESAQEILVELSDAQVQGGAWRAGKMSENKHHVVYNFRCPFHSTHGERKKEHALHVCDVELDEKFPHADHTEIQTNGPHQS